MTRQTEIDRQRRLLNQTLTRVGFTGLKMQGRKSLRPSFPDLSTDKPSVSPTSDRIAYTPTSVKPKAAVPAGFVIGHSHKQGLSIMPAKELEWAGGKKT